MNFAVLGYGFMGGAHLAAMRRIPGVSVAAVASRTRPTADSPARGNLDLASGPLPSDVSWTDDWRALLNDPAIDAVDICLPTDMHGEAVLSALAAGKHVFCEKPMALTTADCETMMQAATASGKTFMVGQVLRFMPAYQQAAKFVAKHRGAGSFTATLQRTTGFPGWGGWLGDKDRSGGAILDLLSHDLDQALHLFGTPESVSAVGDGPVDTAIATLRFPGGSIITVRGGWAEPEVKFSASFTIKVAAEELHFDGKLLLEKSGGHAVEVPLPDEDPYFNEIAYFVECAGNGTAPDLCPTRASADAVRISTLLRESLESNGKELPWSTQNR